LIVNNYSFYLGQLLIHRSINYIWEIIIVEVKNI